MREDDTPKERKRSQEGKWEGKEQFLNCFQKERLLCLLSVFHSLTSLSILGKLRKMQHPYLSFSLKNENAYYYSLSFFRCLFPASVRETWVCETMRRRHDEMEPFLVLSFPVNETGWLDVFSRLLRIFSPSNWWRWWWWWAQDPFYSRGRGWDGKRWWDSLRRRKKLDCQETCPHLRVVILLSLSVLLPFLCFSLEMMMMV